MPRTEWRPTARVRKGERGIWQRRCWEHGIREDRDYAAHVDYVHCNPAKHGLVARAADWPYSSFPRCVTRGLHTADWSMRDADPAELGARR